MKISFLVSLLLFVGTNLFSQTLSSEEMKLYNLIMDYRKEFNLPKIPLSKSLTFVAQTHVKDLEMNQPDQGNCNAHSWSTKGNWTACCYTSDHKESECMWNKPRELTSYTGDGFEIAYWHSASADAPGALNAWKKSSGHNAVVINKNIWHDNEWKAIGIGIYKRYAVVWFGEVSDRE